MTAPTAVGYKASMGFDQLGCYVDHWDDHKLHVFPLFGEAHITAAVPCWCVAHEEKVERVDGSGWTVLVVHDPDGGRN